MFIDVSEHQFDQPRIDRLDDDSATERASELAEQLLDEISRAGHSWTTIATTARTLADLASAMTQQS